MFINWSNHPSPAKDGVHAVTTVAIDLFVRVRDIAKSTVPRLIPLEPDVMVASNAKAEYLNRGPDLFTIYLSILLHDFVHLPRSVASEKCTAFAGDAIDKRWCAYLRSLYVRGKTSRTRVVCLLLPTTRTIKAYSSPLLQMSFYVSVLVCPCATYGLKSLLFVARPQILLKTRESGPPRQQHPART